VAPARPGWLPLIRNYGTLGGISTSAALLGFFRERTFTATRRADLCYAVSGDNRHHAIVGGNCVISSIHPIRTASRAHAQAKIAAGRRADSAVRQLFHGPRVDILRENILKPEELLVEVFIPAPAPGSGRLDETQGSPVYDFAIVSVARHSSPETETAGRENCPGGVAPVPYRAKVIEDQLKGEEHQIRRQAGCRPAFGRCQAAGR